MSFPGAVTACRSDFEAVLYDESIDYDSTKLWSGGINPANLPQAMINGVCTRVYPHNRVRVNTIFEVVHASGKVYRRLQYEHSLYALNVVKLTLSTQQTAYTDKHPSYDIVRGP
jgi:hypothetical protein